MTVADRKILADAHLKRVKRLERVHVNTMFKAIQTQINAFVSDMKANGIDFAKAQMFSTIINPDVAQAVQDLYIDAGVQFANATAKQIKQEAGRKAGYIGENERWVAEILNYLRTDLLTSATIPITNTTKRQIEMVLSDGIAKGLGIDEIANRLQSKELTWFRAVLISRTEIARSANIGRDLAKEDVDFKLSKTWLTCSDSRVRDAHAKMDGKTIDENDFFLVDGYKCSGPGDSSLPAHLICGCRCSLVYEAARNRAGNLIPL